MNYLGPIHCRNCGTVADTNKPFCHCNEGGNSGCRPDFVPYIKEPHDFIALQCVRIAELEAALKLARTALHPFASVLFYVKGEVITPIGNFRPDHYLEADMALKQINEVLKC